MILLSAWALAGLILLAPLVIAHLRRENRPQFEVPSLLLWHELERRSAARRRSLRPPRLPLLLALQALALVLLVLALARPAASAAPPAPTRIYVLDDSLWMGASGRLAAAAVSLERLAAALPRTAPVRIVLADGAPHVLWTGPAGGVRRAVGRLAPGTAPSTIPGALALAAGLIAGPRDRVVLLRAPEDALPPLAVAPGQLQTLVIGTPVADQGIFSLRARCGIGAAGRCAVRAVVVNSGATAVVDRYTAYADGRPALSGEVRVQAGASADIVLSARPDQQVSVRLDTRDPLAADDQAWVTVPGPANTPPSQTVTLVGVPSDAIAVARALAAVPGITLRLRTPAGYRASDARASDLTVLDGWLPAGGLPPSPSVLLIDPPTVPGGRVAGRLKNSTVSGVQESSDLLSAVDLTSLSIDSGTGHVLVLPGYLRPVAWSPDGPLLAAGDDGNRRVAVLSFDPAQSDLPQLASFPILAANLVRWAAGWAPASAPAGEPLRIDATPGARRLTVSLDGRTVAQQQLNGSAVTLPAPQPGLYTVRETGPGLDRHATVAVSVELPTAALSSTTSTPISFSATAVASRASPGPTRAPWLLAVALLTLALEWAYWRSRAPRLRRA